MFKKITFILVIAIIALSTPFHSMGQDFEPGDPDLQPEPPVDAPFDGGVLLLIASGVIYGIKKESNKRKATKVEGVINN
ncbi:MAG: hypothetical protein JWQ40_2543 [Segetibacter sp.]|jgi:hypothetical protein|nr:hypothetical protein [Segetibacter sp.]